MADTNKILGQKINDRYEVLELIGKGGSGQVFKALDTQSDQTVALKILKDISTENSESVIRFEKEVAVSAKLTNPHTVKVFDFGKTREGFLVISMEFLEGRPLRELIQNEAPLSPRRAVSIVVQALEALAEAQKVGIVHRDLKPDNIFILDGEDGEDLVKVLDFGIAKFLLDDTVGDTLSRDGFVFGTPLYISPEQALGWQVTPASDIYSLGVVFFEMLAGYPPFNAETPIGLGMKHIYEPPPLDRLRVTEEAYIGIKQILAAMLEKRPEKRLDDAEAIIGRFADLGGIVDTPFEVLPDEGGGQVPVKPTTDQETIRARPADTGESPVASLAPDPTEEEDEEILEGELLEEGPAEAEPEPEDLGTPSASEGPAEAEPEPEDIGTPSASEGPAEAEPEPEDLGTPSASEGPAEAEEEPQEEDDDPEQDEQSAQPSEKFSLAESASWQSHIPRDDSPSSWVEPPDESSAGVGALGWAVLAIGLALVAFVMYAMFAGGKAPPDVLEAGPGAPVEVVNIIDSTPALR